MKAKTVAKATAMKAFRDTVMNPSQAPKLARGVWPTDPEVLAQQANSVALLQLRHERPRQVR